MNTNPPFYSKESCTAINSDGTYSIKGSKRYATSSYAIDNWCETKEEAIQNSIDYYLTFNSDDIKSIAEVYQSFVSKMHEYLVENRPEYVI